MRELFGPQTVAVIGASDNLDKYGGRVLRTLVDFGFTGRVYPVNPNRELVQGIQAYPSISRLPEPVDHAAITVPAPAVPLALKECADSGTRFVTVFSSGFAETGTDAGAALQAELVEICRSTGLRMVGPNCNGLTSFVNRCALTSTQTVRGSAPPAGRLGLVSQSGGLGQVNVMWRAQQLGLAFSHVITCGNDADLDALDFVSFMIDDEHTDVIMLVVERISSGSKLVSVANRAHVAGKPIVVLKLGRTEQGSRAAASHTGAMTGVDEVYEAVFRQLGIIRAEDSPDLVERAMMLQSVRSFGKPTMAALAISGGNLALLADLAGTAGLGFPALGERTRRRLDQLISGNGQVANPLDLTAAAVGNARLFRDALRILADDEGVGMVIPVLTMTAPQYVDDVITVSREITTPLALLWTGACADPNRSQVTTITAGVPTFQDIAPLVRAARSAYDWSTCAPLPGELAPEVTRAARARKLVAAAGQERLLDQRTARELLALYGIPTPSARQVGDVDGVVAAAREIGYPVALKIDSPDLAHKSDVGGVRLGITDESELRAAVQAMAADVARLAPAARLTGFLVERMAEGGVEFFVGASTDPTFGPVIAAGLGGVHVEVLGDVVRGLPVADAAHALAMLRELRGFPLLDGHRGGQKADLDALAGVVLSVSAMATELSGLVAEADLNPILVLPAGQGALAVDVLVARGAHDSHPASGTRIGTTSGVTRAQPTT